jgi:hypothetical protein
MMLVNEDKKNKNKNAKLDIHHKKNKTRKQFKKATCSPFIQDKLSKTKKHSRKQFSFSCYDEEMLDILREAWNKRHYDRQIKDNDYKNIWKSLRENMSNVCDIESCWYKELLSKSNNKLNKRINKIFAPSKPRLLRENPDNVIDSLDIDNIMKQYEQLYPHFRFIGPSPLDYDTHLFNGECVWQELCEFKLKKYIDQNISVIGVIFNLDNHDQDGSHWVAIIIDLNKKQICFFCSYGSEPEKQHIKFIEEVQKQGKDLGINLKYKMNKHEYQGDTNECGFYCMYVIINIIHGKSFESIVGKKKKKKHLFGDELMNKLRLKYFYNDD